MHAACITGLREVVDALLAAGADPLQQNYMQQTPAVVAILHGHTGCLTSLLQSGKVTGASLNEVDCRGLCALHYACFLGKYGRCFAPASKLAPYLRVEMCSCAYGFVQWRRVVRKPWRSWCKCRTST